MKKIAVEIGRSFFGTSGHFLSNIGDVGKLVSIIVSNAIIVAGIIMLFLILLGGISMIGGAGANNPQKVAQGKQTATIAVIGFIIVFAAYWIIQIIQKITGLQIVGPVI